MAPLTPPQDTAPAADFNSVARAYRWLEYLSLGPLLERTRFHHLDHGALDHVRQALILGDGDGRFTARLLTRNPHVQVTAVDSSAAMLRLLADRCRAYRERLTTQHADARTFEPATQPDLIVTHFFLDCLSQPELDLLLQRLSHQAAPGGLWLVSEFQIPDGWMQGLARLYIRGLYLAFRILTGLRVTHLPDHASALARCGFERIVKSVRCAGLLTSELWRRGG